MHSLQLLIEEAGFECCSYSGRGMYGKQCLGVVLEGPHELDQLVSGVMEACAQLNAYALPLCSAAMEDMCWDNMGLGTIYYWPNVPYTGEGDGDEECKINNEPE